jgi:hypothetical protein
MATSPAKERVELWLMHVINLSLCALFSYATFNERTFNEHPVGFILTFGLLHTIDCGFELRPSRRQWLIAKIILGILFVVVWRHRLPLWLIVIIIPTCVGAVLNQLRHLRLSNADHSSRYQHD